MSGARISSRRGYRWAGREVTLATEVGHPRRAAAGGKGMGFGVTLSWVRIPAPALQLGDLG